MIQGFQTYEALARHGLIKITWHPDNPGNAAALFAGRYEVTITRAGRAAAEALEAG
jgi:hypothetical protein